MSRKPIFQTLNARVRFVAITTVALMAVVAGVSIYFVYQAYRADAFAANGRLAAAATSEVTTVITGAQKLLTQLGDAAAQTGGVTVDCQKLVSSAAAKMAFTDIGLATKSGAVLCDSLGGNGLNDPDGPAFLSKTAAEGSYAVKFGTRAGSSGAFIFAYPARDNQGSVTAVAFATLDAQTAGSMLRSKDGYVMGIADSRGRHILSRTGDVAVNDDNGAVSPDLIVEMLSQKTGTAEAADVNGVSRIYSFDSVQLPALGRLYFYAGGDERIVFARADMATLLSAVGTAVSAALIIGLAFLIGGYLISRKAKALAEGMLQIVQGKREPGSLPQGFNELNGFVQQFDRLAAQLREQQRTLEHDVKLRTSMLEFSRGVSDLDRARYEALLFSVGEGVVATDNEGRISFLNDVARDIAYWAPDKVEGAPIYEAFRLENEKGDIIAADDWPTRANIKIGQKLNTPAPAKPFYVRRRDKSAFPVKMTISRVGLNDAIVGTMILFNDITNEVEFDKHKSEFISIASHQLRTPIAALKWMIDMLIKGDIGKLTPKQEEWVTKMTEASERMSTLVDELLNISRLEAGIKMSPKLTDTSKFVEGILTETEPLLAKKSQKFAYAAKEIPQLSFDQLMIGEVLKNYISNASKYSPENATVTVAMIPQEAEIRVEVKDQGMGIPKSAYGQMFNKYFRAENAAKSSVGGTGLGLYYCKSVVQMHGGQVGFDSEEGKGSTFWFTLPTAPPVSP